MTQTLEICSRNDADSKLYARQGSPKVEPAAVRWLARLALEGRTSGSARVGCRRWEPRCVQIATPPLLDYPTPEKVRREADRLLPSSGIRILAGLTGRFAFEEANGCPLVRLDSHNAPRVAVAWDDLPDTWKLVHVAKLNATREAKLHMSRHSAPLPRRTNRKGSRTPPSTEPFAVQRLGVTGRTASEPEIDHASPRLCANTLRRSRTRGASEAWLFVSAS